tara:strand:- start:180 stop:497 length:318 start_codon:yes stop_codon:yes gene_type:complete
MKNNIIFIICFLFFLYSCQSVKDGLSGRKGNNSDEFLVEKKNPLETPPSFGELPEPKKDKQENLADSIDEDIEKLIENVSEKKQSNSDSKDKSAEDLVLKEIKKN